MMRRSVYILLSVIFACCHFFPIALAKSSENMPTVLVIDTDRDGEVTAKTINKGEDVFLVKPNPKQLKTNEQVFLTNNGNPYTSVSVDDLQNPGAAKQFLVAKMHKDGTIKTMSLANIGYTKIYTTPTTNGEEKLFLVTNKGQSESLYVVKYKAPILILDLPAPTFEGTTGS